MSEFQQIGMIDYSRTLAERAASRKVVGPYMWTPSEPGKGRGFYMDSKQFAMAEHGATIRLRIEEANNHLGNSRLSHVNGYYCDADMEGSTLQPIIARLPHGRGFLPGWTMGLGMCASLDSYICKTEEDAARMAHSMAEHDAEANRDRQDEDLDDDSSDEDSEDMSESYCCVGSCYQECEPGSSYCLIHQHLEDSDNSDSEEETD